LIVPGSLETRTGGYIYDRRIAEGLCARGWSLDVRELEGSFPRPTSAALTEAAHVLSRIPDGTIVLIDGLALGVMPVELERERARLRIVALVHLPLAHDPALDRETASRFEASERRALACVVMAVGTGAGTRSVLANYGVPPDRVVIIEPGTDPAPQALGSAGGPLHLLTVATLNRGKGHDVLFRALARVSQRHRWRLTCVGSLDRDPETVQQLRALLAREGLIDSVSLAGELGPEALERMYSAADIFVLPTLHETYGMAVAEALAHGLPVVSTATGAIPDLIGDEAGLLIAPGDVDALTGALSLLMRDRGVRARLAQGARRAGGRLPSWDDASNRMAVVLDRISVDTVNRAAPQ
jgi:glycosyltransferase involved in cell wall biosynthesis